MIAIIIYDAEFNTTNDNTVITIIAKATTKKPKIARTKQKCSKDMFSL